MRKLNQPMVNWICREMAAGQKSVWRISRHAGVSPRWTREIYSRFLKTGVPPERLACGRRPQPVPSGVEERILREHALVPYGAVSMQKRLLTQGVHLSHNKIHAVLLKHDMAKREPKKQKPRKWVRYERKKANSLWHTDYTELDGKQVILFEDDATRLITGYGRFDSNTAENALQVFAVAVERYGVPRQLLTDNGSHFCNTQDRGDEGHAFHGAVQRTGCEHIFTRVGNPKCNGKLERLNYTIQQLYHHYGGDLDKAVRMYNEERMHMSLGGGWLTPLKAWQKKIAKGLKYEKPTKA